MPALCIRPKVMQASMSYHLSKASLQIVLICPKRSFHIVKEYCMMKCHVFDTRLTTSVFFFFWGVHIWLALKANQRNSTMTQSKPPLVQHQTKGGKGVCCGPITIICHCPPNICKLQRNLISKTHYSK